MEHQIIHIIVLNQTVDRYRILQYTESRKAGKQATIAIPMNMLERFPTFQVYIYIYTCMHSSVTELYYLRYQATAVPRLFVFCMFVASDPRSTLELLFHRYFVYVQTNALA